MHTNKNKKDVHKKSRLDINFKHLYASVKARDPNKLGKA